MNRVVFDIETTATPDCINFMEAPEAPSTYKDPAKIAEYVAKKRSDDIQKAPLKSTTGRILIIGCLEDDSDTPKWFEGPEDYLLTAFWQYFRSTRSTMQSVEWVGYNTTKFDWPFVVQRSFVNGVKPYAVFNERGYVRDGLIDLLQIWTCGDRQAFVSLDTLCRLMGLGGKNGDGAKFGELYLNEATRQQAMDYAANDLKLTQALARRML